MREFHFSDAKSHKFWSIDVQGPGFTVKYGKIGAAGQSSAKTFATDAQARAEADKLIKEKTNKGYVEQGATSQAVPTTAEAMEAALLANPGDVAAWSAYADYLIELGEPRGEFMRVQLALEDESLSKRERDALKKQEAALLKAHEREWLGPLVEYTLDVKTTKEQYRQPPSLQHTFTRGWLTGLHAADFSVNLARAMACPEARLLQSLTFDDTAYERPTTANNLDPNDATYEPGPDVPAEETDAPSLAALCRSPRLKGLRALCVGSKEDQCHIDGTLVHHVAKQAPNLEELYIFAHRVNSKQLFALPLPNLRVLQLDHSKDYALDKLAANASLKNLETLICHPHAIDFADDDMNPYIRLKQITAIAKSANLPKLRHLQLRLTDFGDKGAKVIAESGLLKRLKVLDLQGGCITDEGAQMLLDCPELKNLEYLNLSANAMSLAVAARFKEVVAKVDVGRQHTAVPPFGDGDTPEYLLEGDYE